MSTPTATSGSEHLLQALGVVKRFGDFTANDDVTLEVRPGEIHALLGENGAGKSTLVKIIYGVLQPSAGELRWMGRPVRVGNPAAARRLGIGMVFQHFSLFDALDVTENIAPRAARRARPRIAARSHCAHLVGVRAAARAGRAGGRPVGG